MLTGWRLTVSKMFLIPQRYVLGIMGFFAIVNAYTMRISLSVAITEMVQPHTGKVYDDPESCPGELVINSTAPQLTYGERYSWNNHQQGLILSAFYWGYVLTHIPGGILSEKFGGKHTLGLGILCTALFTCITPFVIYVTDGNWVALVILRVLEGLGEGTTFPALNTLLAQWVPLSERAMIGSLVFAGSQMGTVAGNAFSGVLIHTTRDWASVFYLFGVVGILWVILWTLLCYNDPEHHPFISEEEKMFLRKEIENISNEKKDIPWRKILTSAPVWALVIAQIGHDWGFFTMVTDLPIYMKDVLKFNVKDNGFVSSLPYIIMWIISLLSGWLCDKLIQKKYMTVGFARKFFTAIASVGPGVFILAASYSGCDRFLAVAMFTVAMGFMGTYYCGMKVNSLDLSPNFAGTLMAIVNGIGALTGIVVPYLASALTENHTLKEWRLVFWITFGAFIATNILYTIFGSGEVQTWNNSEKPDGKIDSIQMESAPSTKQQQQLKEKTES